MKTILVLFTLMAATLSYGQMTRDRGGWMPADSCCHMACCADKCCGSAGCCGKCGNKSNDKMHCGTAENYGDKSGKSCGTKDNNMNCSKGDKSCGNCNCTR